MNTIRLITRAARWLTASMAVASVAHADPEGGRASAALALFREGRSLMASGRFADACPRFAESQKLDPGVGTMLNLAYCYEKIGRTASAFAEYLDAAAAARDKQQAEREAAARARAGELEPSLLYLGIELTPPTAGKDVEIQIDDVPIPESLWEHGAPVDPGHHRLRAVSPGKLPWTGSVEVASNAIVKVPMLQPTEPSAPSARPPQEGRAWLKPTGLVVGGVGVVALGIGAGFALAANAERSNACQSGVGCVRGSRPLTDADMATGWLIGGGALAIGGAVLFWVAPRASAHPTAGVAPLVGRDVWGIAASEVW